MTMETNAEWQEWVDEVINRAARKAAQEAMAFYDESLDSRFGQILETLAFTKERLDNVPTRDEFNELKGDVKAIKQAVTATNRDLANLTTRLSKLEVAA